MSEIDQTTEKAVMGGCLKDTFFVTERNLKTVNKIRSFLDQKVKKSQKLALVCFDGMGVAEWILLKEYLCFFWLFLFRKVSFCSCANDHKNFEKFNILWRLRNLSIP